MKFSTHKYANISTSFITESDLELLRSTQAPNHMATHDTGRAEFYYSPSQDIVASQGYIAEARAYGFSERFISIMIELSQQGIQYVRFDSNGDAVHGLSPLRTMKQARANSQIRFKAERLSKHRAHNIYSAGNNYLNHTTKSKCSFLVYTFLLWHSHAIFHNLHKVN